MTDEQENVRDINYRATEDAAQRPRRSTEGSWTDGITLEEIRRGVKRELIIRALVGGILFIAGAVATFFGLG